MRISALDIRLIPKAGAPVTLVKRAVREKGELDKNDEVWCVFDTEQKGQNPTFGGAISQAKQNDLKIAVSNPSFEYWYLIHYELTDSQFMNADNVISRLKKYLPDYSKNSSVYNEIQDKTAKAIINADALRKKSDINWKDFPNPSTGVDALVKLLTASKK